eukprot:611154-Pelagomonas_calceolata.AAC.4
MPQCKSGGAKEAAECEQRCRAALCDGAWSTIELNHPAQAFHSTGLGSCKARMICSITIIIPSNWAQYLRCQRNARPGEARHPGHRLQKQRAPSLNK